MIDNYKNFLITINICCYNSSKYIEETIQSVINQTYKNWELIIIDDGSTDNTKNLIKKYLNRNNNIFYFYKENGGYPSARNKAIKIAKGEWIALIDHDDVMLPNRLENQVNEIIKYNHVKLFSSAIIQNSNSTPSTRQTQNSQSATTKTQQIKSKIRIVNHQQAA